MQSAIQSLFKGWTGHASPQCALLLLRLLHTSNLKLLQSQPDDLFKDLARTMHEALNGDHQGRDPETLVINYPDSHNTLFGDKVTSNSPHRDN
jgi:hypothetical protein